MPIQMTREQYKAKYGVDPNVTAPKPSKFFNDTMVGGKLKQMGTDLVEAVKDPINVIPERIASVTPDMRQTQILAGTADNTTPEEVAIAKDEVMNFALSLDGGSAIKKTGELVKKPLINKAKQLVSKVGDKLKNKTSPLDEALEITSPVLNKKEKIAAFERSGQPGGVMQDGKLGDYKVAPDKRAVEIAESVQGIVTKKNSPLGNIANINKNIEKIAEEVITPTLNSSKAFFNKNVLNSYLQKNTKLPNFIKADPVLQKTYDLTRQSMMDVIDNYPKTMKGLWEARKEFDRLAENQLGNLDPQSGASTAVKQAVLDTRTLINNYIAEGTPNASGSFKKYMRQLNNMYSARRNVAEQNVSLLDKNAIERWMKNNPKLAKNLKYVGGVLGLGSTIGLIVD